MSRNRHKQILDVGFVNLQGAIEMMNGLDYHHDRFADGVDAIALEVERKSAHLTENDLPYPVDADDIQELNHEAVAYVNRIGQFCAFAGSIFVKNRIPNSVDIIPTLRSMLVFRHKHTAHRSIDQPRGDTPELQWVHARSLTILGGRLFVSKQPGLVLNIHSMWKDCYQAYQIYDGVTKSYIELVIQRDHDVIMSEAYSLLEKLITTSA